MNDSKLLIHSNETRAVDKMWGQYYDKNGDLTGTHIEKKEWFFEQKIKHKRKLEDLAKEAGDMKVRTLRTYIDQIKRNQKNNTVVNCFGGRPSKALKPDELFSKVEVETITSNNVRRFFCFIYYD